VANLDHDYSIHDVFWDLLCTLVDESINIADK
jgi:hypothetical protein